MFLLPLSLSLTNAGDLPFFPSAGAGLAPSPDSYRLPRDPPLPCLPITAAMTGSLTRRRGPRRVVAVGARRRRTCGTRLHRPRLIGGIHNAGFLRVPERRTVPYTGSPPLATRDWWDTYVVGDTPLRWVGCVSSLPDRPKYGMLGRRPSAPRSQLVISRPPCLFFVDSVSYSLTAMEKPRCQSLNGR
jgi:hypothetical protein